MTHGAAVCFKDLTRVSQDYIDTENMLQMCRYHVGAAVGSALRFGDLQVDYDDNEYRTDAEEEGDHEAVLSVGSGGRTSSALAFSKQEFLKGSRFGGSALYGPLDGGDVISLVEALEVEVVTEGSVPKHLAVLLQLVAFGSLGEVHALGLEVSGERRVAIRVRGKNALRSEPAEQSQAQTHIYSGEDHQQSK